MGLGDEIMATGDARRINEETGRRVVVLDRNRRPRWHPVFDGNPRLVRPEEAARGGDFAQLVSGPGDRPYADYEAIEALGRRRGADPANRKACRRAASRLFFKAGYRVTPGEIHLTPAERGFADGVFMRYDPFVVVEPGVKPRVPAKQWGRGNWAEVVKLARAAGFNVVQLGPHQSAPLDGARKIVTVDFRMAVAVLTRARAVACAEGGLHHACGAVGARAVVLFGGRTDPAQLGYGWHVNYYCPHKGSPCGTEHEDCPLCRADFARLTPEMVASKLVEQARWDS